MKKKFFAALMAAALSLTANAQSVARQGKTITQEGNTFVEVPARTVAETPTAYTYKDKAGKTYPIYLSSKGKAYIKVLSKKSGKAYRRYLPEVGKVINPAAYTTTNNK